MSTPLSNTAFWQGPRTRLAARLGLIAAVLAIETLLLSALIQQTPVEAVTGAARLVRDVQHWLFRFMIVYAVALAMLTYLRGNARISWQAAGDPDVPVRYRFALLHFGLLLPFAVLTAGLYSGSLGLPFAAVAIAWHVCAAATVVALVAAAAPLSAWRAVLVRTGSLPLYALVAAAAAVAGIEASQQLWEPSAAFTFRLVHAVLRPVLPALVSDYGTLTLSTDRFAVTISEKCSGLEGVGLMLAFCGTWLGYFRHEYRFPRALLILPLAILLVFAMNALRIAALVIIGDAGYPGIATVGFHSQAGWIAFNVIAFGVAILSKHWAWLHPPTPEAASRVMESNPTAAFLMPLLGILAAGMVAHALSAGFEFLYPLRFVAAVAVLWAYRRYYATLDWRFSWRAVATGACLAGLWYGFAHALLPHANRPEPLTALAAPWGAAWVAVRALAAIVTVPIAEELAYRGYLMRRIPNVDFQAMDFRTVRWPALLACALVFGVTHGVMWIPAMLAGVAYGWLAIKTGKIGEAVAAHATTNAAVAGLVLFGNQWQLW